MANSDSKLIDFEVVKNHSRAYLEGECVGNGNIRTFLALLLLLYFAASIGTFLADSEYYPWLHGWMNIYPWLRSLLV
ncbi:hypothetical protein K8Q93_00380 [Candidatus Parcubacteria bacterium]|nr:hypothetical protein [Candidatus Parcubacteria bacterium]